MRWSNDGPQIFTRMNGVPGLRIRELGIINNDLVVSADGTVRLVGGHFEPTNLELPRRKFAPIPGLPGTPIARIRYKGKSIVAVPLRGLFTLDGKRAQPFRPACPVSSLTALAVNRNGELVVGTSDQGVWRLRGNVWSTLPQPLSGLIGADATAILPTKDVLWIAPRQGPAFHLGWRQAPAENSPWRQVLTWAGRTVLRRANGTLAFLESSGKTSPWTTKLPRVTATGICCFGDTLFVAQHGGWSEFRPDEEPRHNFDLPALQGAPTTVIAADAERIMVGTQGNGLVEINRASREVRHIHEAHGLTDDWVTAIELVGPDDALVGTLVGGLLQVRSGHAKQVGLPGISVSRIFSHDRRTWVGSLQGVAEWSKGRLIAPEWAKWVEPDVTDIAWHGEQLWIAAGGALVEIPRP